MQVSSRFVAASVGLFALLVSARSEVTPILHWKMSEGQGVIAQDASGSGNTGKVTAQWTHLRGRTALSFDGTPATTVSAELPPSRWIGSRSWAMTAWLSPRKFGYSSAQNQTRLFFYGDFPKGCIAVDLLGDGRVTAYQCSQTPKGTIDFTISSSAALPPGQWSHLAIVCDRSRRVMAFLVNGAVRGQAKLPPDFAITLGASGAFTAGSGWQNYDGLMADVKLYSDSVPLEQIRDEFERSCRLYGVSPDAASIAATAADRAQDLIDRADAALADSSLAKGRSLLLEASRLPGLSQGLLGTLRLRAAQLAEASKEASAAARERASAAGDARLMPHHRTEAKSSPAGSLTKVAWPKRAKRLYVSPKGRVNGKGTLADPVGGLAAALSLTRKARAKGVDSFEIVFLPGRYSVTETTLLTKADSRLTLMAQKPGQTVFYGGKTLSGFRPVSDPAVLARLPESSRRSVLQCSLPSQGIKDFGALAVRGFGQKPSPPTLEVYGAGKPLTLARWPNKGFVRPAKLVDTGDFQSGRPSVLAYEDPRHERWLKAEDAWLFGYFEFLWADGTAKIGRIDPAAKTLATAEPYHYLSSGMSDQQGIKYYAFNLLEELDAPGEWFLDRRSGTLYLSPPSDLAKTPIEVGTLDKPMLKAVNASDVRIVGLTFDLGRDDGVILEGCQDSGLYGCRVQRFAGNGVRVLNGRRNTLRSCDIGWTGRRATEVIGGNRETLEPGLHTVENCEIHDFGRIDRTYTPGVQLEGAGNRVAHNLFYNCPSSAMRIEGNDHVMEFNEVHHVLLESDDQGAMELYGNPTYRGVIFRHNYYHDIGSGAGDQLAHGQAGIRLDDAISGVLIYGNLFERASNGSFGAIQINSGRDNWIDSNVILGGRRAISGGFYPGNPVWTQLKGPSKPDVFITNPLYMSRYPELATATDTKGRNFAWRNLFIGVGQDLAGDASSYELIANVAEAGGASVQARPGRRELKASKTLLLRSGQPPIPLARIGLQADAWRLKPLQYGSGGR